MDDPVVPHRGSRRDYFQPEGVPWLLRLRWSVMSCQVVFFLGMSVLFQARLASVASLGRPAFLIALILAFEGAGNAVLHLLHRRAVPIAARVVAVFFLFDIVLLAALLHVTGGGMSPVIFLCGVHVVFAAMVLPSGWALAVTVWAVLWYLVMCLPAVTSSGMLAQLPEVMQERIGVAASGEFVVLQLQGFWIAFAITAFFLVYFVGKIRQAAEASFAAQQSLLAEQARNERLASLTTLAAGAAHELSTPLATIAVAAGELQHTLQGADSEVQADVRLIREQVGLCKDILVEMAAGAGELRGEENRRFALRVAMDEIVGGIARGQRSRLHMQLDCELHELLLPFRPFCRVVTSLINNALEASPATAPVQMRWYEQEKWFCVAVVDQGAGMANDVVRQATQPFFTTKESGMGLGLFLARTMAERYGGTLRIESSPGSGTTVVMSLLRDRIGG